jgi:sugar phosphate isomerase/epimerase
MTLPIALQLYTLRKQLSTDFQGVIEQVAAIGYPAVELAGFDGTTPEAAAALFRSLDLQVCSAHAPLPVGDRQQRVIEVAAMMGCATLILAYLPPEQFASRDLVERACEQLNYADEIARASGLTIGYHNHAWELESVIDGQPALYLMRDLLNPTILFELDTYWIKTGGLDPVTVIRDFGTQAPLLHIKDGSALPGQPHVAVGSGTLNWETIIPAAEAAKWLIVELDECATDMLTAVEESYAFLTQKGYAHGR